MLRLQHRGNIAAYSLALSFLLFQLTPPLLPGALQSFHVIPPLLHLSHHLTGECICSTSQMSCHIYFKHSFGESEFTFADGKNFRSRICLERTCTWGHFISICFHNYPPKCVNKPFDLHAPIWFIAYILKSTQSSVITPSCMHENGIVKSNLTEWIVCDVFLTCGCTR